MPSRKKKKSSHSKHTGAAPIVHELQFEGHPQDDSFGLQMGTGVVAAVVVAGAVVVVSGSQRLLKLPAPTLSYPAGHASMHTPPSRNCPFLHVMHSSPYSSSVSASRPSVQTWQSSSGVHRHASPPDVCFDEHVSTTAVVSVVVAAVECD